MLPIRGGWTLIVNRFQRAAENHRENNRNSAALSVPPLRFSVIVKKRSPLSIYNWTTCWYCIWPYGHFYVLNSWKPLLFVSIFYNFCHHFQNWKWKIKVLRLSAFLFQYLFLMVTFISKHIWHFLLRHISTSDNLFYKSKRKSIR